MFTTLKRFFLFCAFVAFAVKPSFATVINQELLPMLIIQSDNIVIGEITSVGDSTYTLSVLQTIKGKQIPSFTLEKDKRDLQPIYRWDKYKLGQIELAFLQYDQVEKIWSLPWSTHGEAELLVNKDTIYLYGDNWLSVKNMEKYLSRKMNIDSAVFEAVPYAKDEMIMAISDFNNQRKLLWKKMAKEPGILYAQMQDTRMLNVERLVDKSLIAFRDKSPSHERLICEFMNEPNLFLDVPEYPK